MDYKEYQYSRNAAWQLLINCCVTELPVKVSDICRMIGVPVRVGPSPFGGDGCCLMVGGRPVILVSEGAIPTRQRFTAAHELGHLMLGHVGRSGLVNREPSPQDDPIEQAANVFASRLLAPACVLWGCGVESAEEIADLCDISEQAAALRWQRMRELYRRGKFLNHPLERQVYAQFREYIKTHRIRDPFSPADNQ